MQVNIPTNKYNFSLLVVCDATANHQYKTTHILLTDDRAYDYQMLTILFTVAINQWAWC